MIHNFGDIEFDVGDFFKSAGKYGRPNSTNIKNSLKRMFIMAGYEFPLEIKSDIVYGNASKNMFSVYKKKDDGSLKRIFIIKPFNYESLTYNKIKDEFNKESLNNHDMPMIMTIEKIFIFKDMKQNTHTFSIIHAVQGKTICEYLDEYDENRDDEKIVERNTHIREKFAKALANFHLFKMKFDLSKKAEIWQALRNDDIHCGNVMYNEKSDRIYFIDIDVVLYGDLRYMLNIGNHYSLEYMDEFYMNYVDAYPKELKMHIIEMILRMMVGYNNKYPKFAEKFGSVIKKYIETNDVEKK